MSADELASCMRALTGDDAPAVEELAPDEFVDQILGFEDVGNDES